MKFNFFDTDEDQVEVVGNMRYEFWKQRPKFFIPLAGQKLLINEPLFKYQMNHLTSALLIDDYNPQVEIDSCSFGTKPCLKFPDGALISGSFIMSLVAQQLNGTLLTWDDIDIYFKTQADAEFFVKMNQKDLSTFDFKSPICAYGFYGSDKVNLIYGVQYDSPAHLISRFDIRACSMAVDPNKEVLYVVRGAPDDASRKILAFNPVPRGVSVRRLIKYTKKGFEMDTHQGVFFAELIKSDIYSAELELSTNKY
jgi:hypothetical protein